MPPRETDTAGRMHDRKRRNTWKCSTERIDIMADNQNQRGGTSEQHAKAGSQSHKNDERNQGGQGGQGGSGEGRGWHGDPQGHAEAGRKGGETVSQDRGHMAEIGKKGG